MSLVPTPSAARGDLIIQPPFFTSSLFVNHFRADIEQLTDSFVREYADGSTKPFALFKRLWQEQGWTYMHLKVFDARTRHTYLTIACRLFLERISQTVEPIHRLVALFGLYTFYFTQPSDSRIPLYSIKHVDIALDQYEFLLGLPNAVSTMLAPYASQVLSALANAKVFYVIPASSLEPHNPRMLPREVYVEDVIREDAMTPPKLPKKKGRPSKRDMAKKAKEAVAGLDRWLQRTDSGLLSHGPTGSRASYVAQKARVLGALLERDEGVNALERANMGVLGRLKKIDAMAAEKGMEVGGEGGELTGLGRVERAAREMRPCGHGGVLSLSEGAGRDPPRRRSATRDGIK
ncbi:hypothetical protein F5148DRAFT_972481 [Russula earlei]|uniref:Uncharacterized protein n=1 Tax=Russula earlei TaxID=71964 RepID=A0ACC0UPN4_9AGAM|nr:hypothetical protein F5148DRAFT_972481 [Russula earlei]